MAKPKITQQELSQAERLLRIFGTRADANNVRALAAELAFLHESAVLCAMVQLERRASMPRSSEDR